MNANVEIKSVGRTYQWYAYHTFETAASLGPGYFDRG